ncbi:MAG: S9 family peptidase [Pseudomonadota bacterium]|nr:S9 family peptidase [Pseudomonadota bacterium]
MSACIGGCINTGKSNDMTGPQPPLAEQRPHSYSHHGITLEDPYHWLKDQNYPNVADADVLSYLAAENDYFDAVMQPIQWLIEELFEEIKQRQKPDDATVPMRNRGYYYQSSFSADTQYRVHSRWSVRTSKPSIDDMEVILDEPTLAKEHDYFSLGAFAVSDDGRYLAYSTDTDGGERYTLVIRDLHTGQLLNERIANTIDSPVWATDNRTIFYLITNDQWRPYQARRHVVGESVDDDVVIYEESDPGFFVGLERTTSGEYIGVSTSDHVTSELRFLSADEPLGPLQLVVPRREGHQYWLDHQGERFVIRTNDRHKNFRLVTAPVDDPKEASWTVLIEPSDDRYLLGFQCFDQWIVAEERVEGIDQIRILDANDISHYIDFPDPARVVGISANAEYQTDAIRLHYSSMVTPHTTYDYDLDQRQLQVRKVQEIPSGYDPDNYVSERLWVDARDGVRVPVSILYRSDIEQPAPLYLYGYGAYGSSVDPSFSTTVLSLLDRGLVFAIAHIRGGDELGYHWYEGGKGMNRTTAFNDFVDVARFLIQNGYTEQGEIAISGASAGGELMGAVVNQAPELWGAVAALVPFVDVLNSMLDTSLPLTPMEWPEWGNPIEDAEVFRYMHGYSPYDQLASGDYPPMLVTAGLNDPRVTYWEPAKYVARLRTLKTDDHPLLLKTNMGAGHGGRSGRYDSLYEVAEEYAFILKALGKASR